MNCPHCQKEMPEEPGAVRCPFCGKDLASLPEDSVGVPAPVKFKGRLFFAALLLPPFLTLISAAIMRLLISPGQVNEAITPTIGLLGAMAGGVTCGVLLGIKAGGNIPARFILSLFFAAMMIIVCVMLCLFGCGLGGYDMRIGR
jgi:hypothetical protein